MKNLEIIVTGDGAEPFLLETKMDSELIKLRDLLSIAKDVEEAHGTCRLTMGEVDETA